MKRRIAAFCSLLLAASMLLPCAAAEADRFSISDPYENIDWQTVAQYKTALHTHTNASDGTPTLKESLQRHIAAGFDIVAVTDHGTVDRGWANGPETNLIKGALSIAGRSEGELEYLGAGGTFSDGEAYTYETDISGNSFLRTGSGRRVLRLPNGIEQNAVSVNAHVTSWFADFRWNGISGYEEGLCGVEKNGGLCVINHPGEYSKARYEIRSENAYDEKDPSFAYHINKFASYLDRYDACIGIDMNSKGDNRTRFDRILWDKLLTRFSKKGETVYGIASSDAHQLSVVDTGFSVLLLPELTAEAAKTALKNGEFFAASHCLGNPDELAEIAGALKMIYGADNATAKKAAAAAQNMAQRVADIESGKLKADEDIDMTYSVLDSDGVPTVKTFPRVTRISVDDSENTITVQSENALVVRFISGGKTLASVAADAAVLDLNDWTDLPADYVRAEVFGEGGIVYTQAFLLNAEENAAKNSGMKVTRGCFLDLGTFDFVIAEVHKWLRIAKLWLAARTGV